MVDDGSYKDDVKGLCTASEASGVCRHYLENMNEWRLMNGGELSVRARRGSGYTPAHLCSPRVTDRAEHERGWRSFVFDSLSVANGVYGVPIASSWPAKTACQGGENDPLQKLPVACTEN